MPFRNDKVTDVIAVLALIRREYRRESNDRMFPALRIDAVKSIAKTELQLKRFKNYDSAQKSIHDACARRLKPDVADIAAFDRLAGQWLSDHSMRLKDILLKHASGVSQRTNVNDFFGDKTLSDVSQMIKSDQSRGAGFGKPEDNKEVETAAIDFVTKMYESKGWHVISVENEKCGFDLICTLGEKIENIEVKGIRGASLSFIITTGEPEEAKKNNKFILYAITQALSTPHSYKFSGPELSEKFNMVPLQFRAVYKNK